MRKELREMLSQLEVKKTEIRTVLGENKVDEAEKLMPEIRSLEKRIKLQQELDAAEGAEAREGKPAGETRDQEAQDTEYRGAFFKMLRCKPVSHEERSLMEQRAMTEGVPTDGGLLVPQDISTRITELKRSLIDLSQFVTVEPVVTLAGSRVIEKDADITPFPEIIEMTNFGDLTNPQFINIPYAVKSRGGILPLSNSLLQDSDQNVMQYVSRWIAKKDVATHNGLILDMLRTLTPKALADLKAVKTVLNVDLDPSVSLGAVVLTNQDGYNWLDTQTDASTGRFLLQDDITQPGRKLLFGKPVVVASNKVLPSIAGTPNKAPLFLGDAKSFAVLFNRQTYEIKATDVGGDAFRRNSTDVRVITRQDIRQFDATAVVYGQLSLA